MVGTLCPPFSVIENAYPKDWQYKQRCISIGDKLSFIDTAFLP
jgi:hypothetical protein